jgi:GNAT superfamily N-acetyltransferase
MTSDFTVTLLADHPDLAGHWAELHWREWGDEPGREQLSWWVEQASKAVQRTSVPAAVIALGADGHILGGVGVAQFDLDERRDRSPWIVGTIVHPDRRGEGIGHALMARLEAWAANVGIHRMWVATGGRAIRFYQQCGWEYAEELLTRSGEMATILTKQLSPRFP